MKIYAKDLIDSKFPPTDEKDRTRNANINRFAKAICVSYDAACKIYDGTTTRINFDTLEMICKTLECTPSDIFEPDDVKVIELVKFQRNIK